MAGRWKKIAMRVVQTSAQRQAGARVAQQASGNANACRARIIGTPRSPGINKGGQ